MNSVRVDDCTPDVSFISSTVIVEQRTFLLYVFGLENIAQISLVSYTLLTPRSNSFTGELWEVARRKALTKWAKEIAVFTSWFPGAVTRICLWYKQIQTILKLNKITWWFTAFSGKDLCHHVNLTQQKMNLWTEVNLRTPKFLWVFVQISVQEQKVNLEI